MFLYKVGKIWSPEIYQGGDKTRGYFEGWYFKIIDEREENVYSIIPGISFGETEEDSHSFIQIINGKTHWSSYITYARNSFSFSKHKFEIQIKNNYFSLNRLELDLDSKDTSIKGELYFKNLVPWPSKMLSPGTMGWYSFVPFMECYHACLSMNHEIYGTLSIDNKNVVFNNGRGYIEKDWGTSFPSSWVWSQCNHFKKKDTSIMVSIANIPWIRRHFVGFIIGFWHDSHFYVFSTYSGAKLETFEFGNNKALIRVRDKGYELLIELSGSEAGKLYSPVKGSMVGEIKESISANIYVRLYALKTNEIIFEGNGRNAGLEIMGRLEELTNKLDK